MNDPDEDEKKVMMEFQHALRECAKGFLGRLSDKTHFFIFLHTAMSAVFFSIEDSKEAMEFIQDCLHSSREYSEFLKEAWEKLEKKNS